MQWTYTEASGAVRTFDFLPRAIIPEPATAYVVIASGGGIGRLPDYIAADAVASGRLERLFEKLTPERIEIFAFAPNARQMTANARVLVEELSRHLATPLKRSKRV